MDYLELVSNFRLNLHFQINSSRNVNNIESMKCLEEIIKYYLENEMWRSVANLDVELEFKKKIFEKFHNILLEFDKRNID